jgi:choice-of-anchor B domain-containing protein
VKVYDHYAYVVSEAVGFGLHIFDLLQIVGTSSAPSQPYQPTVHYTAGFSTAHNLILNEQTGTLLAVGTNTCNGGAHVMRVNGTFATNPQSEGCIDTEGYIHDGQCIVYGGPDAQYNGKEICFFASGDDGAIRIYDLTARQLISRLAYQGAQYSHQCWLSEDQTLLFLGDEMDEMVDGSNTKTFVFNVVDLNVPQFVQRYTSPNRYIDHNMYVMGNALLQANYAGGLRVLRIDEMATSILAEVGHYKTSTALNGQMKGAWSVFPYFGGGKIVVSGDEGIHVLQLDDTLTSLTTGSTLPPTAAPPTTPPPTSLSVDIAGDISCESSIVSGSTIGGSSVLGNPANEKVYRLHVNASSAGEYTFSTCSGTLFDSFLRLYNEDFTI